MQVTTELGPVSVLSVSGRIDSASYDELVSKADEVLNSGHVKLVLDLRDVDFISSRGLSALQVIYSRATSLGGKMVLSCVGKHVSEVLFITGFTKLLDIYPDVDTAQASLNRM